MPRRLRPMTVRFDPIAYKVVASEAEKTGVPIAQFVREAALIRAMMRALVAENDLPLGRDYVKAMADCSEKVASLSNVDAPNHEG